MRRAAALLPWILSAGLALAQAPSDEALRRLALETGGDAPVVRIGVAAGHHLQVTSDRPFRVLDPATGRTLWKPLHRGVLTVVAEGGPTGDPPRVFRIQAGAFTDPAAAEAEQERLRAAFGEPVEVHHDPDRNAWRVRVGKAEAREQLTPLLERLREAGIPGLWIVDEPAEVRSGVLLRLVDARYDSETLAVPRIAVAPAEGSRIRVEGKPYRGAVEFRVTRAGQVRAINWVPMEPYLRGVVPAELGPEIWPQLEALKAQAVAARTYAYANLGQFAAEGYDLCATPRCQVYEGAAAEHPLSDRAVAETRGEILRWEAAPIHALYTATCGGHTEDAPVVFPEETAPYLKGVPCRAEAEVMARGRGRLDGRLFPAVTAAGEDLSRDWALLGVSGILPAGSEDDPSAALTPADLRAWTAALARACGRPAPAGPPRPFTTLAGAAAALAADLGWSERAEVLLGEGDEEAVLRDPEAAALPAPERRALALLASLDALRPDADGRFRAGDPPTRARLVPAVARAAEAWGAAKLEDAAIAAVREGALELAQGKVSVRLEVAPRPVLVATAGGRTVPRASLDLWPGDRIRYRTGPDGRIDYLELKPPLKGVSDDRSSVVYSWEVRRTAREIDELVSKRLAVGRVRDLQVLRRGVSGRVAELRVVGSRGTQVVRGFDVRGLFDLRESLFVMDLQRDAHGALEAVVFAGKGWGHGVGLCQTGAYGMALRGADYRAILAHYYRGAALGPPGGG